MDICKTARNGLALLGLSFVGMAQAGVPFTSVIGLPFQNSLTSTAINQLGPTQTFTLRNDNFPNPADTATIQTLTITGPNQADFQIVPGGTCQPGTTVLAISGAGSTCTVNVAYRPSTGAQEVAQLNLTCTSQFSAGAGYVVTCSGAVGKIGDLLGNIASFVQTPTLSSGALTALALLIFGFGLSAAMRRERSTPESSHKRS